MDEMALLKTTDDDTPTKKLLATWITEDGASIEEMRKALTRAKKLLKRNSLAGTGWITTQNINGSTQMFLIIQPFD